MKEKDKLRGIIAEIVREEIEAIMKEANEAIREIVRAELFPALRSAVKESISKELESVAFEYEHKLEGKERGKGEEEVLASVATSEDEPTITMEAGGEEAVPSEEVVSQPQTAMATMAEEAEEEIEVGAADQGLYLYGIADANAQTKLGQIGIEGNEVYTITYKGLSAIVHNCPLEPYNSEDEEVVKGWVKTHQHVLDVAEDKFGTVIPFGFNWIIKPEYNANAEDALKKWMGEEFNSLMEKMEKIRGKKEYGVQIFYIPAVMSEKIAEESEEIRKIKVEMQSKGPGVAYMYRQKIETVIKKEMDLRMDTYFKNFYEKIRSKVEDIKMEKTKKTEKDKVMMMNLSVLVSDEKSLGSVLEEIDKEEIFSVRFTGPWQPYSFV